MSDATMATSRRDFLTGTGIPAGAAALVSAAATGDADAAERANCAAVNAMLPTPIQMQDFLPLPMTSRS